MIGTQYEDKKLSVALAWRCISGRNNADSRDGTIEQP